MNIKFKKLHPNAVIPTFGKPGDAGADLTAIDAIYDEHNDCIEYRTGISIEIPEGYVGMIFPRSSLYKMDLFLANHVGIIDSGYRGEIQFKFKIIQTYDSIKMYDFESGKFICSLSEDDNDFVDYNVYKIGDRIGQIIIMPIPSVEYTEVEKLSDTERGDGGFGSTGV